MGEEPSSFLWFIAIFMLPHMTASQGFCLDGQSVVRQPGEDWLHNSTTKCSCGSNFLVVCVKLDKPSCTDIRDNIRSDMEMWMNSSCVQCMCLKGTINCSRYDVNVTYGLFNVSIFPTCENCFSPLQAPETSSACEAYFRVSKEKKLYKCTTGGHFIWDKHRCNGISECLDESDEQDCEDVKCMDEEGGTFLIKDQHGWQVSPCLLCHCKGGHMSCQWNITVNFPAYLCGFSIYEESCTQPSCNILQFIRDRKDTCEGVELVKNGGIFMKGQTWNSSECVFYFHGANDVKGVTCPSVARPVCYVYNGAVCCASECPALRQIANQMRGNPAICTNGRLIVPKKAQCENPESLCLGDSVSPTTEGSYTTDEPMNTTDEPDTCTTDALYTTEGPYTPSYGWSYMGYRNTRSPTTKNDNTHNCKSDILCQDEVGNKFFDQTTWSVGDCIQCSCNSGNIHCTRHIAYLTSEGGDFTENCHQPDCNVHSYLTENKDICKACRWNGTQYLDGDRWKENGIDFYCSSEKQKVWPGCFVEKDRVKCTGAIKGLENLSLIYNHELFLCKSGDEIRSLNDRCNTKPDCDDQSDEQSCDHFYCTPETRLGFTWTRTQVDEAIDKHCSLKDSSLAGTFNSKCLIDHHIHTSVWLYTCNCEQRTLVQQFEEKIAKVTEDNLMNVLDELSNSREEFFNLPAFYELLTDVFHAGTKLLTPVTTQTADLARRYCEHVIETASKVGPTPPPPPGYTEGSGCSKLVYYLDHLQDALDARAQDPFYWDDSVCPSYDPKEGRQSLIEKAEGFLRQLPNTTDYQYGVTARPLPFVIYKCYYRQVFEKPDNEDVPVVRIKRQQMILKLNTAPVIPSRAAPISTTSTRPSTASNPTTRTFIPANIASNDSSSSVTTQTTVNHSAVIPNSTHIASDDTQSLQKPAITDSNKQTDNITNQQIKEMLEAYNCASATFDEESGDVIIAKPDVPANSSHSKIQDNLELVLLCISIAAVIFSLVLLTAIRIKKSEKSFVHKNLLLSLGVSNLVLVLDKTLFTTRKEHPALCSTVAVIKHFLHTALFSWMLVEGINLYINLVKVFSVKKQYVAYAGIGWGIPAIIVGVVAAIKPSTYDMSKTLTEDVMCGSLKLTGEVPRTSCWLNGSLWIFKGPVLAALVANLVLFVILLRVIFGKIAAKYGDSKVKATKRGLRSIVTLLPLLGVTWLLGFVFKYHVALEYAFIFLNCTQGIVFCIIHCVFDDQVREALKKHRQKQIRAQQPRQPQAPTGRANPAILMERNCAVDNLSHLEEGRKTRGVVAKEPAGRYEETKL